MFRDAPVGESFSMARTFRNKFVRDKLEYPAEKFRAPSWVHTGNKDWWALLKGFVLKMFESKLKEIGLYRAVRATQYGIAINPAQVFAILELYSPATNTFFTPNGKIGLALHEMW